MLGVWVLSLVGELESHMSCGPKTKTGNRESTATNSVKTLKMVHIKKKKNLKKKQWTVRLEGPDHVGSESLNSTLLSQGTLEGFSEGVPESVMLLRKTALAAG